MNTPRKLPLGVQSFEKLRRDGYLYIDKTSFLWQLVQVSSPYFLSRPRRFGKSLFLSTLAAYFRGQKELFKDLYLENAERILCRDIATLAAFKAWMELVPNSKSEKPLTEHTLMQMYVLEEEKRFAQFKYTATKNHLGTIYYDWKEILVREREIKGKE